MYEGWGIGKGAGLEAVDRHLERIGRRWGGGHWEDKA